MSGDAVALPGDIAVIVAAYNEAERISATLAALARAFPGAELWVADDGSTDATAVIARAAGARVVRSERVVGKGEAVTGAAHNALRWASTRAREHARAYGVFEMDVHGARAPDGEQDDHWPIFLLCDGDLGESAASLAPLVYAVRHGEGDLAVARFSRRVGGGVGLAVGFARFAIRRRCGLRAQAPISGQRALRAQALERTLPFAHGFGMEIGMTIDAVHAGLRVVEVELDLTHRATGRTLGGFLHRGRQLLDFVRVYLARR
ncbi:MAG TPA: glycosyltransferase [Solirubrobacteraceae bacterium]|jgi:glycosyltransferase involved in cell wall biosynthesis